ncbi:DUF302 domain-containing protein [archaeon]|jgi:uncharacterized protein (DUF302 family)|nr:DUF302 domain-containing protein [archaeon]MBT4351137.1 DUF302 domain-containing protein [archaeon]MBT4647363.1 DUF302 domain-containing protein [archaeon]MBT6821201.1 DUF302 domain-containing protein [archaeon]MBT7391253.1 DUF302 domain-containing protein [archaeon]
MKKLISKAIIGKIVYKVETDKSFDITFKDLEKSIKNNNFSIPGIHDLKKTYTKANLPLDKDFEYTIVQLCNAKSSHKALTKLSYDMGVMMPKSIIIAREDGKTTLRFMKMKPAMVGMMFPDLNIAPMSKKIMGTLKKIVDEAIQ